MRLVNVKTLEMEEFVEEETVDYAILSHRWGDGEVSFQDMQNPALRVLKKGFAKIDQGCKQAAAEGLSYFWCDTCCINKDSTAELSEAINSMFRWYQQSKICYAFLGDIDLSDTPAEKHLKSRGEQIGKSNWFERGWTLQELIAPRHVAFYDRNWTYQGSRSSLREILHRRTGIPQQVLRDGKIHTYSVAQRMSWASRRVTTRPEDMAYCLLGIFDINMPLLYGEGRKAFIRLQEEIIKQSDDHSIFAWDAEPGEGPTQQSEYYFPGLLAESPAPFAACANVLELAMRGRSSFSMTNRGLAITFFVRPLTTNTYVALLNCGVPSTKRATESPCALDCIAIFLRRGDEDDQYARIKFQSQGITREMLRSSIRGLVTLARTMNFELRTVHVRQRRSWSAGSPTADAFRVSVTISLHDRHSFLMPFNPGHDQPYAKKTLDWPDVPAESLALSIDHDLDVICILRLCRRIPIRWFREARMSYLEERHRPHAMLGGRIEGLKWKTTDSESNHTLEAGTWALKGDPEGLHVYSSRNFLLVVKLERCDEESQRMIWRIDFDMTQKTVEAYG